MQGIRGAITVKKNDSDLIKSAAKTLIKKIIKQNNLSKTELVSIIFSATDDLDKSYPAEGVREMEIKHVPLMCYQEMNVQDSLPRCLRAMVYTNKSIPLESVNHVYLRKAKKLRPDLVFNNKNTLNQKINPENISEIIIDENLKIGGKQIVLMAGPCAVENEKQILKTARIVKKFGAQFLRGGAYKPRTSPHSFQGLKEKGLKLLKKAGNKTALKIITEVMDPRHVDLVGRYTDIYQIGARNMQNYYLLKEVGKTDKPVLLKRGMNASYQEFLGAAEYIKNEGNKKIILCERGIKTFENYTRYTLDLISIPVLKKLSNYPIIIDPSHGTGRRDLVIPAVKGAIAMGADGLLIEVHPNPEKALSDGAQSLYPEQLNKLIDAINASAVINNRRFLKEGGDN